MKLKDDSIFDRAVIVTLADGNLYYEYATRLPIIDISGHCNIGVNIYKNTGFSGKCLFWIEKDNVYLFVMNNENYMLIDSDDEYTFLKANKCLSDEEFQLIESGYDILNSLIVKGGLLGNNGI